MPYSKKFVRGCIFRGFDWMVVNYKRVELDHFFVILEQGDGELAWNIGR
jgi:hypothetical protein